MIVGSVQKASIPSTQKMQRSPAKIIFGSSGPKYTEPSITNELKEEEKKTVVFTLQDKEKNGVFCLLATFHSRRLPYKKLFHNYPQWVKFCRSSTSSITQRRQRII